MASTAESDYYWWGALFLLRRFALCLCAVVFRSFAPAQAVQHQPQHSRSPTKHSSPHLACCGTDRRHVVTVAGCGASDHYSLDASSIQSQVESLTTVSTRPPHWPLSLVNRASLHHCPYNCVAGHFGISAPIGWTLRAVHPLQLTVSLLYTSTTSTSFRSIRRGPPHWTLFSVF